MSVTWEILIVSTHLISAENWDVNAKGVHTCSTTCASWISIFILVAKIVFIAGVGYHLTVKLIRLEAPRFIFKVDTVDSLLLFRFDKEYYWLTDSIQVVFFCSPLVFGQPSSVLQLIYSHHHPQNPQKYRRMPEKDAP